MKKIIVLFFFLCSYMAHSQINLPLFDYYKNSYNLKFDELKKECSKEKWDYDALSAVYKKEVEDLPERVIQYYKDSLNTVYGDDPIEKDWLLNYKGLMQDKYLQIVGMASSSGITIKEMYSIALCNFCSVLVKPDNDSPFLLEEDKPSEGWSWPEMTTSSNTQNHDKMIIDRDIWIDYVDYIWVQTSWNSSHSSHMYIEAPLGTQVCDIDFNVSGRGNKKVKFAVGVPNFSNSNLEKHVMLRVTAEAYGDNEWHDRKSASCRVDVKRVRLIPFFYTLTDRERLGCRTSDNIIRSIPPENYVQYLEEPEFHIKISDLKKIPDKYPNY
jgi:hypothetical protein